MSSDLLLKPMCRHCHTTEGLYGSNCKHMTLCMSCGTKMAEQRLGCMDCGVAVTRLIREYNVRPCSLSDKNYFIGRFVSGLPHFSKKKNSENKWSLQKEALQGRQQTDALREKYKNKPWLLEEETGQFQYSGHMEGAQSATYYLLIRNQDSKEFSAIPASSWYNFNKVAQYKQLTLEEAEEKMKNRRKTADGYQRWMMKAANNGPAAFGEVEKFDDKETGGGGGRGRKKSNGGDDDESNVSDRGEEDEEEEAGRKNRLKLKSGAGDDDEEGLRGGDLDFDDDNIEKGDDWEHEEIFTDDDEALGNDAEEREDLAPEIPPPPEIKQDEEDEEDDTNEEEGRLSKSGKELQKLLGRSNGESESDAEEDDDEDDDDDSSPVLAPKKKDGVKEEAGDNSPSKPSGSARGTPSSSKSTKGKRKTNGDDAKASSTTPSKKVKQEIQEKSLKDETGSNSKSNVAAAPSQSSRPPSSITAPPTTHRPVTEDEIRAVLLPNTPMTTQALVGKFKPRLRTPEDKESFTSVLKKVGVINKNKTTGKNFVVLKDGRK